MVSAKLTSAVLWHICNNTVVCSMSYVWYVLLLVDGKLMKDIYMYIIILFTNGLSACNASVIYLHE